MKYDNVVSAKFIERPNRFIAKVDIDGKIETVHVKNTGRCKEILIPGCTVYLSGTKNPARKTKFDLIAVEKNRKNFSPLLINMDSQAPNQAMEEWLKKGNLFSMTANIRREVKYNNSRFDFFVSDGDRKIFLEVKGVTLEEKGVALFPDAPTDRGIKHINELMKCMTDGYEAYLIFVIQMKEIIQFSPNYKTHVEFGKVVCEAQKAGVNIIAVDCRVTSNSMVIDEYVPVKLL